MESLRLAIAMFFAFAAAVLLTCGEVMSPAAKVHSESALTEPPRAQGAPREEIIAASILMKRVALKYKALKYYRSRGTSQYTTTFPRMRSDEIAFAIENDRGKKAHIKWNQNGKEKDFYIQGKNAWLTVDSGPIYRFGSPRDGLGAISLADGGWPLFGIKFFVFRDELLMGNVWFAYAQRPKVFTEEEIDGRMCYLLKHSFDRVEGEATYWIDKELSVIRRIQKLVIVHDDSRTVSSRAVTTENYFDIEIR